MEAYGLPRVAPRTRGAGLLAFARPHTVAVTAAGIGSLAVLARALGGPSVPTAAGVATALVAGIAVNIFVVGLDQLTDVANDREHRAWLPLPAGSISATVGRVLVVGSLPVALVVGAVGGRWLLVAVGLAAAIGAAYCAPPLRLKRHHATAAASLVAGRGLVANVLVYVHLATSAGSPPRVPAALIVVTAAIAVTSLALAWLKDLPGTPTDRRQGTATLPARLGAQRVVALGVAVLALAYTAVAAVALLGIPGLDPTATAVGHALLAVLLWWSSTRLRLRDEASVARFAASIWVLLALQYGVFAAAALPWAGVLG